MQTQTQNKGIVKVRDKAELSQFEMTNLEKVKVGSSFRQKKLRKSDHSVNE